MDRKFLLTADFPDSLLTFRDLLIEGVLENEPTVHVTAHGLGSNPICGMLGTKGDRVYPVP